MATSEVAIINNALIKLGEETIIARTDQTNRARVMNSVFDATRDLELRKHRWRFAIKRRSMPALAVPPDSDFARAFAVPDDFLRLIEGGDLRQVVDMSDYRSRSSQLYSLENGQILTDLPAPLAIRYIARVTDTSLFDSAFDEALACRLAFTTCKRITDADSAKQVALLDYRTAIKDATLANALEIPAESIADDTWVMARAMV